MLEGSECASYASILRGGDGEKGEGLQVSRGDSKGKGLGEVGLACWRKERRK